MITGMQDSGIWWLVGDRVYVKGSRRKGTIAGFNWRFGKGKRLPNEVEVDFDDDGPDEEDVLTIADLELDLMEKLARDNADGRPLP